jgi:hypothetical protein
LGLVLAALIPVLHVAHATGLRNLLAATIAVWALILLWRARQWPPLALPVMAWIALGAGSAAWSPDAESTLKSVFYDVLLPFGVMYTAYLGSRAMPAAVTAGTALLAVFTAYAFFTGQLLLLPDEGRAGLLYYYPGPGASSTLSVFALPVALLLAADAERAARRLGFAAAASAGRCGNPGLCAGRAWRGRRHYDGARCRRDDAGRAVPGLARMGKRRSGCAAAGPRHGQEDYPRGGQGEALGAVEGARAAFADARA